MKSDTLTELERRQYKAIVKMDEEGNLIMTLALYSVLSALISSQKKNPAALTATKHMS